MKHATQRHGKVLTLLTFVALVFASFPFSTSLFAQAKKPINKDGLVAAIRLRGFSTKELIKQIETRGVSFEMTSEIEAEMRGAGAPPEVIESARTNYHPASYSPFEQKSQLPKGAGALTINSTVAGCQVLLNGVSRGVTNNDGMLRLPVKAGRYKVALKKEHYEPQERSITVTAGAEAMESFALTPVKGSLTVIPNIAGATIRIREVDYTEAVKNLSLIPDNYEVRVSKPGYRTVTRTVTISPGQPLSLPLNLEVMKVEEMLVQGEESLRQRNYSQTISIAKEVLSAKPDEPKANLLLGLSYFYAGNYDASVSSLVKAILLGEQVAIPVQHHTKYGIVNDNLTPGVLIIGRNLLEFRSMAGSPVFSVPFDKVYRVLQEDNRGGRIQIKVGNPAKKKDGGKDYNFHPLQAGLRQVVYGNSVSMAIYCENCLPTTQAIYQVILQAQQSASQNLSPLKR